MKPEVTQLLRRIELGDSRAASDLLPLVYSELRRLAANRMAHERPDHTLQATALVHEAYLRLVNSAGGPNFDSEAHFYAAAAESMRRILIDHARKKSSLKRGGEFHRVDLNTSDLVQTSNLSNDEFLELDDLLEKLKAEDALVAELVTLRLYAGLSVTEASKAMKLSRSVGYEYWDYALSWFAAESSIAK